MCRQGLLRSAGASCRRGIRTPYSQSGGAIGSLEAERATEIGPPYVDGLWDFKVIRLIPEGSEVKEGDLLIEFDEEGVTRRIGEQRASIERAQEEIRRRRLEKNVQLSDLRIRAEEARVNLERAKNKASVDPQLTSMQDYRQIQIQLEMATNEAFRVQEKLKATTKMYDAQIAALQSSLKTETARGSADSAPGNGSYSGHRHLPEEPGRRKKSHRPIGMA